MRPASFISSFKRVISVLVLLALVISGVLFLSRALAITDGPEKNGAFLRDDRQYDVLLFGSSHMVNGIYPMELWKNYGITAYDLGGHGASLAASYWEMRLAVEKHKPKVAVLDVLFAGSDYTEMEMGLAHELFDPYPLSRLKIQAVRDIFANEGDRMELLFPLDVEGTGYGNGGAGADWLYAGFPGKRFRDSRWYGGLGTDPPASGDGPSGSADHCHGLYREIYHFLSGE